MGSRLQLQTLLESILGSENVYFQPPEDYKIEYPCIIYSRSDERALYANDKQYNKQIRYQLIVIDEDPDSVISSEISSLPMCAFDRHYTKDNLNHDVYNMYY